MIILVRHGEATHHTQHLTGGWTDSDLTEAGRSQLEALAEKLALDFKGRSEKFRILASDLKRAAESAAIIAARLHMDGKVEKHAFLREKKQRPCRRNDRKRSQGNLPSGSDAEGTASPQLSGRRNAQGIL